MLSLRRKSRRAFALFELLVVCAIMALVSAGCLIMWDRVQREQQTKGAVEQLYSCMLLGHARARLLQCTQMLNFLPGKQAYAFDGKVYSFPRGVTYGGSGIGKVKVPPSQPKEVLKRPITFVGSEIQFYSEGKMQSGIVYIGHTKSDRLYALSNSVREPFFVRLYRYEKGKWILAREQ